MNMEGMENPSDGEPGGRERGKKSDRIFFWAAAILIGSALVFGISVSLLKGAPADMTVAELHDAVLRGEDVPNSTVFNGFTFVKYNGLWHTRWQKGDEMYYIPLRYNPQEVLDVMIEGELDDSFQKTEKYVTFDPEAEGLAYIALAAAEFSFNAYRALGIKPIAACTKNVTDACNTRPIVTCEDKDKSVVYLKESEDAKVVLEGNCLIIQGSGFELLKPVDRVLYQWYGIIS